MSDPLSAKEEALYREGLRNAPTVTDGVPWSLLQVTTAEWADRCRRLVATLDRDRGAIADHRPGIVGDDADPDVALEWWLCCSCGWDANRDQTGWIEHLEALMFYGVGNGCGTGRSGRQRTRITVPKRPQTSHFPETVDGANPRRYRCRL